MGIPETAAEAEDLEPIKIRIPRRYAPTLGVARCSRLTIAGGVRQANWSEGPFRCRWARSKTLQKIQTAGVRERELEAARVKKSM